MTITAEQAQQRIDELRAEIKTMELVMKDERDKRRAEVKIERTYHVKPMPSEDWNRILDPAVTCYEIGATTMNAAQAREAGHAVDPDGGIRYLWNTVTERFIMRIGGGTVYAQDDETLHQVELFLQVCPDGGDITDIIEAGRGRVQARRHAELQEVERERAIYRKRQEARKQAREARARKRQEEIAKAKAMELERGRALAMYRETQARERQEMAETEAIRKSAERAMTHPMDAMQLPPRDVIACGARPDVPLCPACIDAYRNGIEPGGSACDDRHDREARVRERQEMAPGDS